MPKFTWVNTMLANLKTMINGVHKGFNFGKYASQYLGAFSCRFNLRVNLRTLLRDLLNHAANASPASPVRERQIRGMAEVHD